MKLWCKNQGIDEKGVYCTAHIHECRVFNCPYKDYDEMMASYPHCSDYVKMEN